MNLRLAHSSDTPTITQFNIAMAKETENRTLHFTQATSGVKRLLENPQYGFYIVAELEGQLAGSLMITYEWSDWRDGIFWWIQSVYVKPEFRRRGIFRQLYCFAREKAQQDKNVCGLRLYVEKHNAGAQKTYEQMGMSEADYKIFEQTFETFPIPPC